MSQATRDLAGVRGVALAATLLAFAGVGAWIYQNTNVLNEYVPSDVRMDRQAHYEKAYRKFKDAPQPKIADIYADVDIFPAERRVEIRGRYKLINKHQVPITDLHVSIAPTARLPRAAKLEDESARTSAGQIALAPGYLQKEWTQDGRHYFHYKMDRPMLPFFCYLSADWQVKRDRWRDVPIEIHYDAKHPYNVDRMIDSTKKSLDYFTRNFSPYQHRQVRILEFPRYARFAQSFANTIPFSESIGFIADLRDPEDIDYVFYVTAHEVAHQWWGHQIFGADVQGQTMLVESLAQYSALMVMEQEYGATQMRKFLKYELDRYLKGRGGELIEELPLMRVENQQYIHYQKGSLVFYRLRDEIGEAPLNRALAKFLADKAYQEAPFTTTKELLDYVRAETPPEKGVLLDELFAKIVFYDNRVTSAKAVKRADGKYDVTLEFSAKKREADGTGKETPLAMNDWIDVGAFARGEDKKEASEKVLYLQKHHITAEQGKLTVVVDAMPYEVGVDPYNKLIDRIPDDNRKEVE